MKFNKVSNLGPELNLSLTVFFFSDVVGAPDTSRVKFCFCFVYTLVININAAIPCLNGKVKVNSENIPEGTGTKIKPHFRRKR